MTTEERSYVIEEYAAGRGRPTQIAERLGLNVSAVASLAHRFGLDGQCKSKWDSEADKILMEEYRKPERNYVKRVMARMPKIKNSTALYDRIHILKASGLHKEFFEKYSRCRQRTDGTPRAEKKDK